MWTGEMGNVRKCKRSEWLSENPKCVWWNNKIKDAVRRKEAAWKEMLAPSAEKANERCMEAYIEKKRKVNSKKKVKLCLQGR